jgi:hypothetical protein
VSHNSSFSSAMLTVFFLSVGSLAHAKLKDTPPKNISAEGSWRIDVEASDDPEAVIDEASGHLNSSASRGGGLHGGRHGGSSGGMGGHHGHGQQDASTSNDEPNPSEKTNRTEQLKRLREFAQNPETLAISAHEHALRISSDTASSDCEAGEKISVIDTNGTAERQCGWDGRAWLVETAYAHSYTRSDRYEISKDGKQLTYTTKVSGGRVPSMKINRVYTKVESQAPKK